MKIDAVLARHPWPWTWSEYFVVLFDANRQPISVLNPMASNRQDMADAILELVEAHVARNQAQSTHSEECWRWHHGCAVAMVRKGEEEMAELLAASGDILLSFTAGTECRIPHHQVERLFKAVHGKDAKTPWEDDEEDK